MLPGPPPRLSTVTCGARRGRWGCPGFRCPGRPVPGGGGRPRQNPFAGGLFPGPEAWHRYRRRRRSGEVHDAQHLVEFPELIQNGLGPGFVHKSLIQAGIDLPLEVEEVGQGGGDIEVVVQGGDKITGQFGQMLRQVGPGLTLTDAAEAFQKQVQPFAGAAGALQGFGGQMQSFPVMGAEEQVAQVFAGNAGIQDSCEQWQVAAVSAPSFLTSSTGSLCSQ